MRSDSWLQQLFNSVWEKHFSDVDVRHPVRVEFGRRARSRLGSLSYEPHTKSNVIRVSGLFRDSEIPRFVVKATIVHELCHYAHGFYSGHIQKFDYPHAGGVVKREFTERGLGNLYIEQKKWLKENWPTYVRKHFPPQNRRRSIGRYRRRFAFRY